MATDADRVAEQISNTFGVGVWLEELPTHTNNHLLGERVAIRDMIKTHRSPLPDPAVPFAGPVHPLFTVIGEAPGRNELIEGKPFVGSAGRLIRNYMRIAGIDPEQVLWTNLVCREPRNEVNKNRPPTDTEIAACKPHFDRLMNITGRYVLLVGKSALDIFRPDLQVTRVHGRTFIWDHRHIVMPTVHPAAVLRNANLAPALQYDLINLARIVSQQTWPVSDMCAWCNLPAAIYDRNAVGYCNGHKSKAKRKKDGKLNAEQMMFSDMDTKTSYL